MRKKINVAALLAASCFAGCASWAFGGERIFTLDADFDEGTLVNLNHNPLHDQLQLAVSPVGPFPFIRVACSGRGTAVLADTRDGRILGEYRTEPDFLRETNPSPSRTTVDSYGNWWTANRGEVDGDSGSVVKMGVAFGGTRCNKDGIEDPNGEYLKNIAYNTCIDRNKDGLIRTSRRLGDILPWPDMGDGAGGADGLVEDAEDECILIYQRLPGAPNARHVSVDRNNDAWVAGYPEKPTWFYKLDGETGAVLEKFNASEIGCGGYGGLISDNNFDDIAGNDVIWSSSLFQDKLLRYDLSTKEGLCIDVKSSYGLAADRDGYIWNSMSSRNQIVKINPSTGMELPGFPAETNGDAPTGTAVTHADNHAWVANRYDETVSRLDSAGNVVAKISVGKQPTGVAVDAAGKVWVTNMESNNMMRINPATNAVDLTVDLGANAYPYNYSDMTGIVHMTHPPMGFWDVVHDSAECTIWDRVSWTGIEDPGAGSQIKVEVRAAATKIGLTGAKFVTVANGAALEGVMGRFIEVRTTLVNEDRGSALPVLEDLTLSGHPVEVALRDIPDQKYRFGFAPIDLDDFLLLDDPAVGPEDVEWTYSALPPGWSVVIDKDHVAQVVCPEGETNDVPIVFTARLRWGGDECAASDEVVFLANHPPVPCGEPFECLWSANHKYNDIPLTDFVCDPDEDPVSISIRSITSDEPTADNSKDRKAPDAKPECIGTDIASIRAESNRERHSDGRVYVISFVASDGRGGVTEMTLPVRVPTSNSGECDAVDSGQLYDATEISVRSKK